MNPAIPLNKEPGLTVQVQNLTRQAFHSARAPISLPKKDELLMLLHLKRLHEDRQNLPERQVEHILAFPLKMVK
jgi:hypothetical protein